MFPIGCDPAIVLAINHALWEILSESHQPYSVSHFYIQTWTCAKNMCFAPKVQAPLTRLFLSGFFSICKPPTRLRTQRWPPELRGRWSNFTEIIIAAVCPSTLHINSEQFLRIYCIHTWKENAQHFGIDTVFVQRDLLVSVVQVTWKRLPIN